MKGLILAVALAAGAAMLGGATGQFGNAQAAPGDVGFCQGFACDAVTKTCYASRPNKGCWKVYKYVRNGSTWTLIYWGCKTFTC
jgi:hypothetical protein